MNAGKLGAAILLLVVVATAVAAQAVLSLTVDPAARSLPLMLLIHGVVTAIVLGTILVPVGVVVDRSSAAVRRYIERTMAGDGRAIRPTVRWFGPIIQSFVEGVDNVRAREQTLQHRLRESEIRQHVAEASRRQNEAVFNSLRDGVIVTDPFDEIVTVNATVARELGFQPEEVAHRPVHEVIDDEHLCQFIRDTRESGNFSDRRYVEHELTIGPAEDGVVKVYEICLSCVANHKGEPGGVVTILHDLTREREIAQRETDFVSKASHELRTPLSSIRAYVEMLVDGEATDEDARQEFYRIIQNETHRLGRLIDNMLNISRIEAGIVQIDREDVDMKAVIARTIDTLGPHAREKDISLHTKLAPVDLRVEGDPDMLYQVVLNLVSNAVKYTPEGGRVTVTADSDNLTRSVLVSIADTGLGIPPDAIPHLFDKFYRVENYKRVAKGTGLGLSLCKHIVETVHHGQIGIESKLGMGSRFWFTVPMRYAGSRSAA